MKGIILSAQFLVSILPASLAAPAAPIDFNALNPEWYPVPKSFPSLRHGRGSNFTGADIRGVKDDPSANYIVILHERENRTWSSIFDDMGFSTKEVKQPGRGFSAHGKDADHHGYRTFEIDDGSRIRAFGTNVRMFSMNMLESEAESMGSLEYVAAIEKDQMYYAGVASMSDDVDRSAEYELQPTEGGEDEVNRRQQDQLVRQHDTPWNLQRISSSGRVPPNVGGGPKGLGFDYVYDKSSGAGVDVYMLDTGFNQHVEFGDRATMEFSAFGLDYMVDDHGHGTHTAGTVGSSRYGVAKGVNLRGYKVLDSQNSGSAATILAGLEAALAAHLRRRNNPGFVGSVISMSIGGGGSQAQFNVLQRIVNAGMHVAISAMNDNTDACRMFPGGYSTQLPIFNVGATDINDNRASFSNYGPCVNIQAPGVDIVSTSNENPRGTRVLTGTSMACPAVSGLIAVEMVKYPQLRLDPQAMRGHIQSLALNGMIRGAPQVLLNNGVQR
ncbi:hypothetical protein H072_5785 [Dactylellina haptotyla CBS 200.50]|uniref:Peptidase S8/S53 domain-containing protein n=1 Tax=Dactylellina haptotyla (strain CBS 200.50) TaxID=1284197 RepID=S8ABW0_DACHA|nr:hypothetical protein H072_5785 [Dactylellina haptotyla CBS 200.50]